MELKWKLHQYTFRYSQYADSPVPIMGVRRGTLVTHVAVRVAQTFNNTTSITIGDGDTADGFGTVTHDSTRLENLAGVYFDQYLDAAGAGANGKLYTTDDTIDVTYTASDTPSQGLMTIYIVYAEIE